MSKESRNRENSASKLSSGCLRMSTCEHSWSGGTKCSKNRCRHYKDPRDPKNRKNR